MYALGTPAPALRPYVEHYWFLAADDARPVSLTVDVFVDVRADLVFNLGVPYERTVLGEATVVQAASNLDSQRLRPIRIAQRGAVVVAGVRFRVGGLAPFVGPVSTLTDRVVDVADVFGADGPATEAALGAARGDIGAQTAILDRFLLARLRETPEVALAQHLIATIAALAGASGEVRIAELAASRGLAVRQTNRVFLAQVGVAPKTFARIARFQRALAMLTTDPGCNLVDVGAACGYYDQPHFVREFKEFAGVSPRAKVGYFPADAPTDFEPNLVRFVQD